MTKKQNRITQVSPVMPFEKLLKIFILKNENVMIILKCNSDIPKKDMGDARNLIASGSNILAVVLRTKKNVSQARYLQSQCTCALPKGRNMILQCGQTLHTYVCVHPYTTHPSIHPSIHV